MLTRLQVTGFKNLVDVDVRFGPFTCIAGVNGVGKSNVFDAITFLSALADRPLVDAALSIRGEGGRSDIKSLFHRVRDGFGSTMRFIAEMIVPPEGVDDLGQYAKASITFLQYTLALEYIADEGLRPLGALRIIEEQLVHINLGEARKHLYFPHTKKWRESILIGRRSGGDFISTETSGTLRTIQLHQDGGSRGKPRPNLAENLPRTVLSAANAAESPTALLARREMQSWRLLQLEPSSLRAPDSFSAPIHLTSNGGHLPATLYHLARNAVQTHSVEDEHDFYAQIANRLANLLGDVRAIWIDRDERRELLTLYMRDRYGAEHAARSLSDGTLRFLALEVLERDPGAQGLLCFEEPENGIHPERIPVMLELLSDLAVDAQEEVSEKNPLRQVIVNTHSPAVVGQVNDDDLLIAQSVETRDPHGKLYKGVQLRPLPETWYADAIPDIIPLAKGTLLSYLSPIPPQAEFGDTPHAQKTKRVVDRPDLKQMVHSLWETSDNE